MGETHPTPAENTNPISAKLEGREVDPAVLEGNIDDRMAALLKDHQEMGARPEQEPQNTDLFPPTLPLSQNKAPKAAKATDDAPKATGSSLPKSMTSGAKKAPKGSRKSK